MRRFVMGLFILASISVLSGTLGCSAAMLANDMSNDEKATGSFTVDQPLPARLSEYASLGVFVTCDLEDGPFAEEIDRLAQQIADRMRTNGEIADVRPLASEAEEVDLHLIVTITHWKRVTSKDRFWFGKMAGRSELRGVTELKQRDSGEILGRASFLSYSGAASVMSGTTSDVIDSAAVQVAKFMTD